MIDVISVTGILSLGLSIGFVIIGSIAATLIWPLLAEMKKGIMLSA